MAGTPEGGLAEQLLGELRGLDEGLQNVPRLLPTHLLFSHCSARRQAPCGAVVSLLDPCASSAKYPPLMSPMKGAVGDSIGKPFRERCEEVGGITGITLRHYWHYFEALLAFL